MKHYLNLGCNRRYHSDWVNVDFTSTGKGVLSHDLTKGIPFPDNSFKVVYHSHLLEHLPKASVKIFLKECHRVLCPQGILRIAVPDLEQIARTYLAALEGAISGSQEWAANYQWIILEMYDQTVRHYPGGEMATYFHKSISNQEFVIQRCGVGAKELIEASFQYQQHKQSVATLKDKLKVLVKLICRFFYLKNYREMLLKLLLGQEYQSLQIGRFRQSGEVHQWMYDRYSLALLLQQCGFKKITQCPADASYIQNWSSFNLDTEPDGTVYKPDSLYMEAIKLSP